MQARTVVFIIGEPDLTRRVINDLAPLHLACRRYSDHAEARRAARREQPTVAICADIGGIDAGTAASRLKSEPGLDVCWCLMMCKASGPDLPAASREAGCDDYVSIAATPYELRHRVSMGLRISEAEARARTIQLTLDALRLEQERDSAFVQNTTLQLVEMAADLQVEIVHNAEAEQAHLQMARADVVAEAAAALRHEINNPLFAIIGSADAARRKLDALGGQLVAELAVVDRALDRIQRGANRIQRVVEAISRMLTPTTKEYVAGVAMLDLRSEADEEGS